MKYAQLLATLTEEPLLITPASASALLKLFHEHRNLSAADFRALREGIGMCGEDIALEQSGIVDGIMLVPVGGPIGRGLSSFEKGAGCVDVADITDELDTAEDDPNCRAAILVIDSPGGMVNGTPELSDRIEQFSKPIHAFVPGDCCSAAFWIASACDGIWATKSADIGCIGVYCYMWEQSEAMKMQGIKPELITSGIYKGMGAPGIPLSDAQRAFLQKSIDGLAENFYRHVEKMRPDVSREDMQGQTFPAPEAMARGLIDGVVRNIDEVAGMLSAA